MKKQSSNQQIKQIPVANLIPYARNAKKHDDAQIAKIAGSIKEFGFTNPVLTDGENGILAGHGRVLAAAKLGIKSVPCIELSHLTPTQRRAYILADNRLAEIGGGWDMEMLKVELDELAAEDVDLEALGFGGDFDLGIDPADTGSEIDAEPQTDKAEELREKWGVETGQLWQLGDHRILCGDSTKAEDVERVMGGEKCETIFYDPEWNADFPAPPAFNSILAFGDGSTIGKMFSLFGSPTWLFAWDCVTSWFTPNRPLRRMKLCAWYGDIDSFNIDGSHYGEPSESKTVTNSRGSYEFKSDPRGKHLSDVFQQPITKLHSKSEHSHSKPIDWVRMLIADCTSGDVYDPFSGSGTTIIACEQLGRKCRAIEISPAYVAVAIQRWADATGNEPKRL